MGGSHYSDTLQIIEGNIELAMTTEPIYQWLNNSLQEGNYPPLSSILTDINNTTHTLAEEKVLDKMSKEILGLADSEFERCERGTLVVTGATGSIGPEVVCMLQNLGFNIVALVRQSSDKRVLDALGVETHEVDYNDANKLTDTLNNLPENTNGILHMASQTPSNTPDDNYKQSDTLTENLTWAVANSKYKNTKFILASSISIEDNSNFAKAKQYQERIVQERLNHHAILRIPYTIPWPFGKYPTFNPPNNFNLRGRDTLRFFANPEKMTNPEPVSLSTSAQVAFDIFNTLVEDGERIKVNSSEHLTMSRAATILRDPISSELTVDEQNLFFTKIAKVYIQVYHDHMLPIITKYKNL